MCLDLPAPTNVRATALTPGMVEVTWDQSDGATEYAISYGPTAPRDRSMNKKGNSSMSHILTDLKDDTNYVITVQGIANNGSKSVESNQTSVRTLKG